MMRTSCAATAADVKAPIESNTEWNNRDLVIFIAPLPKKLVRARSKMTCQVSGEHFELLVVYLGTVLPHREHE